MSRDVVLRLTNLPDAPFSTECSLVWLWGYGAMCALLKKNQSVQPEAEFGRHLLSLASNTLASTVMEKYPDMPIIFPFREGPVPRDIWIVSIRIYPLSFWPKADSC